MFVWWERIAKLKLSESDVPYATIRCITPVTKVGRCSKQRRASLPVSPTLENERRCTGCTLRRVVLDPEVNPHPAPCISRRIYPARLRTYQFRLNYSARNPLLHCNVFAKVRSNAELKFLPRRTGHWLFTAQRLRDWVIDKLAHINYVKFLAL